MARAVAKCLLHRRHRHWHRIALVSVRRRAASAGARGAAAPRRPAELRAPHPARCTVYYRNFRAKFAHDEIRICNLQSQIYVVLVSTKYNVAADQEFAFTPNCRTGTVLSVVLCGAAEKHESQVNAPERGSNFCRVKFFRQYCISLPFEQRVLGRCAVWRGSNFFFSIGIRYHFAWGQIFSSALILHQYGISGGHVSTVHF